MSVPGVAVTGTNQLLGAPVANLGAPLGLGGFATVGGFNSAGSTPLALTPSSPRSSVLATYVDPGYLALFGLTPADVKPEPLNVPLHRVPANTDSAGLVRRALPTIQDAAPEGSCIGLVLRHEEGVYRPQRERVGCSIQHAQGLRNISIYITDSCETARREIVAVRAGR